MSNTLGIIGIHQHQIQCIVGVHPKEREKEQLLLIDAKVKIDFSPCFASQQLNKTVDYGMLAKISSGLAAQNHYFLLERFASDLLDEYMKRFQPIWAWVKIQKPGAISTAAYAYVELERYREGV